MNHEEDETRGLSNKSENKKMVGDVGIIVKL